MDLLLTREYWPGGTNGRLYWRGEFLSLTIEPPASHFRPHSRCIPEGKYGVELDQNNDLSIHQLLSALEVGNPPVSRIAGLGMETGMPHIVLASAITGEGKGVPDYQALRRLKIRIGQALGKGEKSLLEIRSCPEQALNLTYHQIAWMD
ncbi:hypothetical protein J0A68_20970 [Algoriphagus sp. H41]|uniref:DUF5675 domain-containing protein n=1 Tax=Algoriphagus oliviformis TaxID=2811231 RepID=A0ABS3C8J9_9BACT|nr:DUF5675 family protein [Algoriphagus oliviformis]MBN7813441.1 hypothetical protein [Algoriphagus oliviformis]